jgi:cell division septation protein DedD
LRRLIALTLAVAACRGDRQAPESAHSSTTSRGPDAIALRLPRTGGTARAYLFPKLDSAVWAASGSPAVGRVLGFDAEAGLVAFTDDKGQPRRLDLRLGEVRSASKDKLTAVASANGNEIYGVNATGSVVRMTPSGDWTFKPPGSAQAVYPQPDGALLIAAPAGVSTHLWRIRPPDEGVLDSTTLRGVTRGPHAQAGDRLYLTSRDGLVGVRTRDLTALKPVSLSGDARAMAPTPSGDRVYVAIGESPRIAILDRYREALAGAIELRCAATDLRIDQLGQFLLAKPANGADSAWVIAIGTGKVTGSVATEWATDLPAFAPSGTIATLSGSDVVFVDGSTLRPVSTVRGGAKDYWYFFSWNGFRPRAANLDQPVTFAPSETARVNDSMILNRPDTGRAAPPMRDASPTMVPPPVSYPPAPPQAGTPQRQTGAFMVSFATVLNTQTANEIATGITVGGMRARVVQAQAGGTPIFRVVVGPFASREEAERIGRESKRQYWIYEGGT